MSFAIAALLAGAILFGGGGAEGQLNNGLILGASALLLFSLVGAHLVGLRPLPASAIVPILVLAAFLIAGALQLVPMQAGAWRALPGRELAQSALRLVGAGNEARPLSLDPEATRRSLALLLLPASAMIAVIGANRREISLFVTTMIVCVLISAIVGALQLGLGYPAWLTYYDGANAGAASGVFANVNHHGMLLLSAIVLVGIAIRLQTGVGPSRRSSGKFHPAWLLLPLFMVVIFATGSRAALLLLVLAVPVSAIVGFGRTSVKLLIVSLLGVALVVFALSEITPPGTNVPVGQSFVFSQDMRYAILPDVLYTLRRYWPSGSGLGTFAQAFAVNENLDIAGYEFVNHAHNDFLELLIETGFAGAFCAAAAFVALLGRMIIVQWRDPRGENWRAPLLWGGFFVLALLALHSLADYPLRTPAISVVAGLAAGLVFVPAVQPRPVPGRFAWPMLGGAALIGLLVGAQVFTMYAAQAAVRQGDGATALKLDPANGAGLALAAEEQLNAHRNAEARALASRAIRQSPVSPRAVRVLAMANDLDHRPGLAAWRVASAMGWRDPLTQYWAMQQALINREYATAAIRADALLRTSADEKGLRVGAVRGLANSAPFRAELIRRLQLEPRWAQPFFAIRSKDPEQQVSGVAATLSDLARSGALEPRDARGTIQALLDRSLFPAAIALDKKVRRHRPDGQPGNLDFGSAGDDYVFDVTPFDWNIAASPGMVISVEQSENRRVLILGTDGRTRYQPVRRYIALAPGDYRLRYSVRGASNSPAALGISVACAGSAKPLATSSSEPLEASDFVRRELAFGVSAECPVIVIAFEARPSDGAADAQFADLSLNRN